MLGRKDAVKRKRWQLDLACELAGEDSSSDGDAPKKKTAAVTSSLQEIPANTGAHAPGRASSDEESPEYSKGKAFAWMDSEDEAEEKKIEDDRGAEAQKEIINVVEVITFSDFIRHSEKLLVMIPSLTAADLVAICMRAAEAHYFDGDLIESVWQNLRQRIPKNDFNLEQLTIVIASLRKLNAYDSGVFHAAAQLAMPQIETMPREQRLAWIEHYESVNHKGDKPFLAKMKTLPGLSKERKVLGSDGRQPCRHFLRGGCWLGKTCAFSHEPGLSMPEESEKAVMLNSNQAKQGDTYRAMGGQKIVLH